MDPVRKNTITAGGLTDAEIADIVAYLQALKSESLASVHASHRLTIPMATIAAAPPYTETHTHAEPTGVWSWLTTVDHKRIGALYLVSALFFFMPGGLEAAIMRAQLDEAERHSRVGGNLQSAVDDARHDDGVPCPSCCCQPPSSTCSFRSRLARVTSPSRD